MAKNKRQDSLTIPLAEDEKKKLRAKAAKLGLTMSSYGRMLILKDTKEE